MSAVLNTNTSTTTAEIEAPVGPPQSVASATERLAASRQRLQIALAQTAEANRPRTVSSAHAPPAWMDELKAIPGVGIVVQALSTWWAKYPLNTASVMAFDAANAIAKPVATRHPVALVLAALAVGGMLAYSRPWRWILKPALLAGLMAQLSAKLVAQMPLQSWMSLLTAMAQGRAQTAQTANSATVTATDNPGR
jgi:hypothetical protein